MKTISALPTALLLGVLALSAGCRQAPEKAHVIPVRVAAAADLGAAFRELGDAFTRATGREVSFTFGSTGMLAKQISEGAPFDVFAAANESFITQAVDAGACFADTKARYARGRVVLYWPKDTHVAPPQALTDLEDDRFVRVAIANPEHAPYGRAAAQALRSAGVLGRLSTKLVYGENVQQTLQFADTGNAEAAIVALSLATVARGEFLLIDEALHEPLDQALAVCKSGADAAGGRQFAAYVSSPEGRTVMRRYGFLLPGEALADRR